MPGETLLVAAAAGLASFLSPCMVPVLPAFLAGVGATGIDGEEGRIDRGAVAGSAVAFVAGFAGVFAVLGVAVEAALAGADAGTVRWLSVAAGVLVIGFGLHVTGLLRVTALEGTYRLDVGRELDPSLPASFALGGAFAVGWTPCVGPVLGSAFALAAAQPASAFPILLSYALGLGIPFLAVGLVPRRALSALQRRRRSLARLHRASGVALLALGVLLVTGTLPSLGGAPLVEPLVEVLPR